MADCRNFIHDWEDHYYGIECKNCKLFVPDGHGPWSTDLVIDDKGKQAKLFDAAGPEKQGKLRIV